MTIYYSATTNAFYDTQVYNANNIPEDKVTVSASTYKNLMAQQCAGRVIVAASNGAPTTIAQTCGPCTSTKYATKTELTNGLAKKSDTSHTHRDLATKTELTNGLAKKSDTSHTHRDLATKTELTNGLAGKADKSHTHSDLATKTELSEGLSYKANLLSVVDLTSDQTVQGVKKFTDGVLTSSIKQTIDTSYLKLQGGNTNDAGACLVLSGGQRSGYGGGFALTAGDGTSKQVLQGKVSGPLTWGGKDIAIDENVVHKTGNETVEGVKTFTRDNSNAAIVLTHGSFKKGDVYDVHVARLYTGDGASYAKALSVYDVGTSDSGDQTATSIVSIENTAGVREESKRTGLHIIYHKNPTDGRKQYATLSGDFLPLAANTYNLGSETNPWSTLYTTTGVFKDDVWVGGDQLMITSDETEVFTGRRISWAKNTDTLPTKAYNLNFSLGGNNSSAWANRIGGFRVALDTLGNVETAMYAHDTTGASKGQGMIGIYYRRDTDSYETIAPTPPAGDNSTQIATTAWSRDNFVTLDTAQSITGQKTIDQPLIFNNTTASYSYIGSLRTVPFAKGDDISGYYNQYNGFAIVTANSNAKNANRFILVDGSVQSNGDTSAGMSAFSTKAGTSHASIKVSYNRANDVFTTHAPTPPSGDNSTQIATTEWVNSAKADIPKNYLGRQPKTFKTLWTGHFASDSVTLSEPFTNYKWLLVKLSNDSDWGMHYHYISTYDLNKMLNGETHGGHVNKSVTLGGSYLYWNIHTYANGSTTTYFSYEDDNCRLREIIGINEFY